MYQGRNVSFRQLRTCLLDWLGQLCASFCREQVQRSGTLGSRIQHATDWLVRFDLRAQVSPVGTIAAVSTIKMILFSGARVQCTTPFGTTKP
jgi:hypothetical protein